MNGKSMVMLGLAVFSGLGAMYGTSRLMSRPDGAPVVTMRDVVAAAQPLKVEEVLEAVMRKVLKLPEEQAPAGSFASIPEVVGRSVQIPMLAGEAVVDPKLAPKGAPPGLVAQIPRGMRAFAIEVNEQSGVSGFILPGHRVDVVQTREERGQARTDAEIILQNVLVLASGQVFSRPEDKSIMSRTVTLALEPRQVEEVVAARSRGPISLSLRGLDDDEIVSRPEPEPPPLPPPIALAPEPEPVVAAEPAPPPPAPEPPRRQLTIHHGMHAFERHALDQIPTTPGPGSN